MSVPSSSSSSSFVIIGLDELNKLFTGFPIAFRKIFQQAGTTFTKNVYSQAYKIVPVKTGFLRSTIGTTVNQTEIRIYATADYAAAVHEGSRGRAGRPFLRTPVEQFENQLMDDIGNGIINYFRSSGG